MGTKGTQIVGVNVKELIEMLNKAMADEWLAVYQYWAGAKVLKGPMREAVEAELKETEHKFHQCLAIHLLVMITPDLKVFPCCNFRNNQKYTSCIKKQNSWKWL